MKCQVPACGRKVDEPVTIHPRRGALGIPPTELTSQVCASCAHRLVEQGYSRAR